MTADRLRMALDGMLDPCLLTEAERDDSGRITGFRIAYANLAACRQQRATLDELVDRSALDLIPVEDRQSLFAAAVAVVDVSGALDLPDHRIVDAGHGAGPRWFDIKLARAADGFSVTWRDVSERHEALRRLTESEERFRLLAENATDLVLWSRGGLLEWISPSVTSALGWTEDDLVGRPSAPLIHPDDLAATLALRDRAYDGHSGQARVRWLTTTAEQRWFKIKVAPMVGADGRPDGAITSGRDITEQVAAEEALAEREHRYRLLAENASDLVFFADSDVRSTWIAPTVTRSLGWSVGQLLGSVMTDLVHPDDWDVVAAIREVASSGDDVLALRPGADQPVLARLRRSDGRYRWMSVTATRVHEVGSDRNSIVVGMRDVDELVATQELAERGKRDALTGLVNRLSLIERMEQILAESRRTSDRHAVLYCDVDYFKEINDTYGHAIGDDVLRRIAARIRRTVRQRDVVARLGGDEFVVILKGVSGPSDAEAVAEKIRVAMLEPLMVDGIDLSRSFSIGVAMVRSGSTPDRVLRDADAALYEAKEAGRDRTITHRPPMVQVD